MNLSTCRTLVFIDLEIEKAEQHTKELKKWRKQFEEVILNEWLTEQPRNVSLAEGPTLQLRRDIHVSKKGGVESEKLVAALKESGLEWITGETYNAARLKAWVKEQEKEAEEQRNEPVNPEEILPEAVRELVNIHESTKIVVVGKNKMDSHEG